VGRIRNNMLKLGGSSKSLFCIRLIQNYQNNIVYFIINTDIFSIIVYIFVNKKVQLDATVCGHLFTAKSLYMFRASQHPSSGALIRPCWKEVAVPVL